jgi:hypothetical protein
LETRDGPEFRGERTGGGRRSRHHRGRAVAGLALGAMLLLPCAYGYEGSAFATVRDAVFGDPYEALPAYPVSREAFGPAGETDDNRLRQAARRTLTAPDDLYDFPEGRKLIQPNGICFAGRWRIDAPSPYTGLLATGAQALAIVRASVSLGETSRGQRRSFAMAIKLFPTDDAEAVVPTANLFVMDSVAGSMTPHFLDAVLDNDPDLGGLPSFAHLGLALRIRSDLTAVDRALSPDGPDLTYRPVTAAATAGLASDATSVSPRWLRLSVRAGTPRVDAIDFRDELRLSRYPEGRLGWEVEAAAAHPRGKGAAAWQRIGTLGLSESVTSRTCDARLHFAHPLL